MADDSLRAIGLAQTALIGTVTLGAAAFAFGTAMRWVPRSHPVNLFQLNAGISLTSATLSFMMASINWEEWKRTGVQLAETKGPQSATADADGLRQRRRQLEDYRREAALATAGSGFNTGLLGVAALAVIATGALMHWRGATARAAWTALDWTTWITLGSNVTATATSCATLQMHRDLRLRLGRSIENLVPGLTPPNPPAAERVTQLRAKRGSYAPREKLLADIFSRSI